MRVMRKCPGHTGIPRMTFTALLFLALAMSTDAFAAAIAKGAALRKPTFPQALRIGLLFGCIETITPVIGWALVPGAVSHRHGSCPVDVAGRCVCRKGRVSRRQ